MARRKAAQLLFCCGLALSAVFSGHARAEEYFVGSVYQLKGESTFLHFARPYKLETIHLEHKVRTGGSFLTHDRSNLTLKLVGDSWLRASVNTKFTLDFDPTTRALTVNLLSGSVKLLFSSFRSKQKLSKLVVKSADAVLESVEGKFSVVRNNLTDETSIYVEKGVVTAGFNDLLGPLAAIPVHGRETASLRDRKRLYEGPREMEPKELKFLNSLFYIGGKTDVLE